MCMCWRGDTQPGRGLGQSCRAIARVHGKGVPRTKCVFVRVRAWVLHAVCTGRGKDGLTPPHAVYGTSAVPRHRVLRDPRPPPGEARPARRPRWPSWYARRFARPGSSTRRHLERRRRGASRWPARGEWSFVEDLQAALELQRCCLTGACRPTCTPAAGPYESTIAL